MKTLGDLDTLSPSRRRRAARTAVGLGTALSLLVVLSGCRSGSGQLVDDLARALGRSQDEIRSVVAARTTTTESGDDLLRRWVARVREPSELKSNARIVACQTATDILSSPTRPTSDETLLTLINNLAGLEPVTGTFQYVRSLQDAAVNELGEKSNSVTFLVEVERFKAGVCR